MSDIKIGTVIATYRKKKGITQEELAKHLGISKPAVSKWESGQSYPDILLLPVLASYFDISVDELIGYEPQMTKEAVNKLYHHLAQSFVKEPFEKVYAECEEYLKKYFACWELQVQMALLLLNHANLAGGPEQMNEVVHRALQLLIRVEECGDDVVQAKMAIKLQALCYLLLQQPQEAIDRLEDIRESLFNSDSILVKAYQMKGDKDKAMQHLQGFTYVYLMSMLGFAPDYFMMYGDQPVRMEHYYQLFTGLADLFELEDLHPAVLLQLHLAAATAFAGQKQTEKALEALEQYVKYATRFMKKKFQLHGNRIFDTLDSFLKEIDMKTDAPRSMEVIVKDIKSAVIANPVFAELQQEERFQRIKKRLEADSGFTNE